MRSSRNDLARLVGVPLATIGSWAAGGETASRPRGALLLATSHGDAIYVRDEFELVKRRHTESNGKSKGVIASATALVDVFTATWTGVDLVMDTRPDLARAHLACRYVVLSDGVGDYEVFDMASPIGLPRLGSVPHVVPVDVREFDFATDRPWNASTVVTVEDSSGSWRQIGILDALGVQVLFADQDGQAWVALARDAVMEPAARVLNGLRVWSMFHDAATGDVVLDVDSPTSEFAAVAISPGPTHVTVTPGISIYNYP